MLVLISYVYYIMSNVDKTRWLAPHSLIIIIGGRVKPTCFSNLL